MNALKFIMALGFVVTMNLVACSGESANCGPNDGCTEIGDDSDYENLESSSSEEEGVESSGSKKAQSSSSEEGVESSGSKKAQSSSSEEGVESSGSKKAQSSSSEENAESSDSKKVQSSSSEKADAETENSSSSSEDTDSTQVDDPPVQELKPGVDESAKKLVVESKDGQSLCLLDDDGASVKKYIMTTSSTTQTLQTANYDFSHDSLVVYWCYDWYVNGTILKDGKYCQTNGSIYVGGTADQIYGEWEKTECKKNGNETQCGSTLSQNPMASMLSHPQSTTKYLLKITEDKVVQISYHERNDYLGEAPDLGTSKFMMDFVKFFASNQYAAPSAVELFDSTGSHESLAQSQNITIKEKSESAETLVINGIEVSVKVDKTVDNWGQEAFLTVSSDDITCSSEYVLYTDDQISSELCDMQNEDYFVYDEFTLFKKISDEDILVYGRKYVANYSVDNTEAFRKCLNGIRDYVEGNE